MDNTKQYLSDISKGLDELNSKYNKYTYHLRVI